MHISMSAPDITESEINAVSQVLRSGWLSNGPHLKQFEKYFADYLGISHTIGVNSGTSALHLTMIAAGVTENTEVITASFSFVASVNCILYEKGIPVLVDIDSHTGNLNPKEIEAKITERTKAIIVVHAFGQPADMDAILMVADKYHLTVIEDACEAIGAEYKGQKVGTLGQAGTFAFYPNKQMTTGEGGMLVTNDEGWDTIFRSLRNQGRDVFDGWLTHNRLGYNYRLDEMSAALGVVQLARLEELLAKRAQVAEWYNQHIDKIDGLDKPYIADTTTRMSWFVYVVRCSVKRDLVIEELAKVGIPSRPYFTPIHLQPFYLEKFGYSELPNTEKAGQHFMALPFSSVMSETQVDYVCCHLEKIIREIREI